MDRVAAEEFDGNRSSYIESLIRADLERRGRLDLTPAEKAIATAKTALHRVGPDLLIEHLNELLADEAQACATADAFRAPSVPARGAPSAAAVAAEREKGGGS